MIQGWIVFQKKKNDTNEFGLYLTENTFCMQTTYLWKAWYDLSGYGSLLKEMGDILNKLYLKEVSVVFWNAEPESSVLLTSTYKEVGKSYT